MSCLLGTAIIAESAIVVRKNCVERNRDFGLYNDRSTNTERKLFIDPYCIKKDLFPVVFL